MECHLITILVLILYYTAAQAIFYIIEHFYKASNGEITIRDHHSGIRGFLTGVIEYGILNRYSFMGYKNNVRANMRILSSLFLTLLLALIVFIFEAKSSNLNVYKFLGVLISAFIIERQILYTKWKYLADLYNQMFANSQLKNELNEANLCVDILDMEMWTHQSFKTLFRDKLKEAVNFNNQSLGKNQHICFYHILKNGICRKEARDLLCALQADYVEKYHSSLP